VRTLPRWEDRNSGLTDTGEVLHIRLRTGSANTSRGIGRFCEELIARVDRAGGRGEKLLRADSGFWNNTVFDRLDRAGWQSRSVSACNPTSERRSRRSTSRRGSRWRDYPETSIAQVAETTLNDGRQREMEHDSGWATTQPKCRNQ
jgi:hypothetical protein